MQYTKTEGASWELYLESNQPETVALRTLALYYTHAPHSHTIGPFTDRNGAWSWNA